MELISTFKDNAGLEHKIFNNDEGFWRVSQAEIIKNQKITGFTEVRYGPFEHRDIAYKVD